MYIYIYIHTHTQELNMQLQTAESKIQRAHREQRNIRKEEGACHSNDYATLGEQYVAEIGKLDEQCRALRKAQKDVKEGHEGGLKQKRAFMQLEGLMQIKLKVAQGGGAKHKLTSSHNYKQLKTHTANTE